jgi:hypothetical protein
MLPDKANKKANKFELKPATFSQNRSPDEQEDAVSGRKWGNVLPLERPKQEHEALNSEPVDRATAEMKSRLENVLARIKSSSDSINPVFAESAESSNPALPGTGDLQYHNGNGARPPTSTVASHVKALADELEKRRAEVLATAREAEARAQAAEEKYQQAEARFAQENDLRLLAEQHIRQIDEKNKRLVAATEEEELKRLEIEIALADAEARLKEAVDARAQAEAALAQAEAGTEAANRVRGEAEKKRAEAEDRAVEAEKAAREIAALINEAESLARAVEERCKAAEVKWHQEAELRTLAEQQLKTLEEELALKLDLDWSKLSANLVNPDHAQPSGNPEEFARQLQAQVEAERGARLEAEQARADAEVKVFEAESRLRKAEEKHRQAEAGLKKVLRKQETELRALSQQVSRMHETEPHSLPQQTSSAGSSETALAPVKHQIQAQGEMELFVETGSPAISAKGKLVSYGLLIVLLLAALIWLGIAVYQNV